MGHSKSRGSSAAELLFLEAREGEVRMEECDVEGWKSKDLHSGIVVFGNVSLHVNGKRT